MHRAHDRTSHARNHSRAHDTVSPTTVGARISNDTQTSLPSLSGKHPHRRMGGNDGRRPWRWAAAAGELDNAASAAMLVCPAGFAQTATVGRVAAISPRTTCAQNARDALTAIQGNASSVIFVERSFGCDAAHFFPTRGAWRHWRLRARFVLLFVMADEPFTDAMQVLTPLPCRC